MLFHPVPLHARGPSEPDALRAIWPTAAEPATFAPPLGIEEDDSGFTLFFDVANRDEQDLEVQVEGRTLIILGEALPRTMRWPRRARRAFALPSSVDSSRAWMELNSPVLKVAIPKGPGHARRIAVQGG